MSSLAEFPARTTTEPPKLLLIREIADKLGIPDDYLEYYGKHTAKLRLELLSDAPDTARGKLILVTAVTPRMLYRMKRATVRPKDTADAAAIRRRFSIDE